MDVPAPLPPDALRRVTDPAGLGFATTAELQDLDQIVGQDRAVEAVRFAIGMRHDGYNLFALGPEGIGKYHVIRQFLERRAATEPVPPDVCYVHDFEQPQRPRALRLPVGRGAALRDAMDRLSLELRSAIPAAFETDEYRDRKAALEDEAKRRRDLAVAAVEDHARQLGVAVISTPLGLGLAPLKGGEVLGKDEFKRLSADEQARLNAATSTLEEELERTLEQVPRWERSKREAIRTLNRDVTKRAVGHLIDELRRDFADLPEVLAHLDVVERDVVASADEFIAAAAMAGQTFSSAIRGVVAEAPTFRRFQVNLLVDHRATSGAPVVYEDHPTQANLIGRVEHTAQLGALVTDFTLIRAGALHRANGGYLVLDARKVLTQPYAWEELKRALRAGRISIESLGQSLGLISTVSLEPEPIPLDVKVALVGDRLLYYMLCELDPDFLELFKVQADFDDRMDRTPESDALYARLIATLARRAEERPLDATAVARVIEQAARLAGDSGKVSTHMRSLTNLLREADRWADEAGHETVTADDVDRAVDAQRQRAGRIRDRMLEEVGRGTILIETSGEAVGQVNGLSVVQIGEAAFGQPSRITARARLGRGEVVDIEREVALGGPIHSKGVLILTGFLGGRYARRRPLALQASLVFEQSYAGVDGDSASLAEACALLSAIGQVPLRQSLAVTGSIDQQGNVQPVGGVDEKLEGFHDVCERRGWRGGEGAIIPAANVRNLMLRRDVVEAAEAGRFRVYAVRTADEALELLTGMPAGAPDADGQYPPDSVNGRVAAALAELAEQARAFSAERSAQDQSHSER